MNKKITIFISLLILTLAVISCNVGNTITTPSITATLASGSNPCTGLTNGESCSIIVSYNTNGGVATDLGFTPNPLPQSIVGNDTFYTTFISCNATVNTSNGSYTCQPIVITYMNTSESTNLNLAFTFSGVTSNSILVTGN